ncbi:hypothetical protein B0H11DRAFT_2183381 [Mycena galericulata]|nr:hypothetical protein B0H11DRAFT_2183381 [Mycena galericulata]
MATTNITEVFTVETQTLRMCPKALLGCLPHSRSHSQLLNFFPLPLAIMHFNTFFLTLLVATGLAVAITLPDAAAAEKSQCFDENANCLLTNPSTCCSGSCCCGVAISGQPGGCSDTPCSIFQEEGTAPGRCGSSIQ